jgi:hypothetical protein
MDSQNEQINESNSIYEFTEMRRKMIGQTSCCLHSSFTIVGGTKVLERHRLISLLGIPRQYKSKVMRCLFLSSRDGRSGWSGDDFMPRLPSDTLNNY